MRIRADLCCYHCGYVAATVEGERDRPLVEAQLIASNRRPGVRLSPGQPPRCGRCGGPLYLDELTTLVLRVDDDTSLEPRTQLVPASRQ